MWFFTMHCFDSAGFVYGRHTLSRFITSSDNITIALRAPNDAEKKNNAFCGRDCRSTGKIGGAIRGNLKQCNRSKEDFLLFDLLNAASEHAQVNWYFHCSPHWRKQEKEEKKRKLK